ncbi:MAG TPA: cytochrome c oxidase subunit II [Actinomycetota bacterium]|nr:cytochrome c oxidase subunit II [Actinomycetota bacterium]
MDRTRARPPRDLRPLVILLVALCAVALAGCESSAPQDFLNHPEGPIARKQDGLWDLVFAVAVAIFVIVESLLVYTVVRFRQKPGRQAAQFHGNTKVEIILTLVPSLILAAIAVPTVKTIFELAEEPPGAMQVTVTARQFWWEYRYEDQQVVTANELHIPVDTPIRLRLEGADVIHSFWVPRLAGKQDVVPGRINFLTIEADDPGEYLGQCTEFCGASHANMRLRVYAHEQKDFDRWLADQQKPADVDLASRGADLFMNGTCVNCHAIGGTDAAARTGPDLTHFASRNTFAGAMFDTNRENLVSWLADPPAMKPGSLMPDYGLSNEEIDALVEFLLSLE